MKKHILLISIIFASCSTIKTEEQIVKDFIIEKKLKNTSYIDQSFLIEEAGSNEKALDFYETAFLDKNLDLDKKRIEFGPRNSNNWPIDLKEITTLKSIHKKDSLPYYWEIKNLKSLEIPILNRKELMSKAKNSTISINSIGHIISKPILSLDKKHAFFTYFGIFYTGQTTFEVYLVEKVQGKWKIMAYYFENYDYRPGWYK